MNMSVDVKYRTTASGGCEGQAWTEDGRLEVQLSTPKELGGAGGGGSNPEQLFAVGYAACFLSALKGLAHQVKVHLPDDASVTATIGIGSRSEGGFGITADLVIDLPGIAREDAERLVETARQICPYSKQCRRGFGDCLSGFRVRHTKTHEHHFTCSMQPSGKFDRRFFEPVFHLKSADRTLINRAAS